MKFVLVLFPLLSGIDAESPAYVLDEGMTRAECAAVLDTYTAQPDGSLLSERPTFSAWCVPESVWDAR